jgi:peptide/nickel transport system permease protein
MSVSAAIEAPAAVPSATERRRHDPLALAAGAWLVLLAVLAITADWLPIPSYSEIVGPPKQPPGLRWPEFLGTDQLGRSELSRIIFGVRSSLAVSLGGVLGGVLIGATLGLVAGYFRGRTEGAVRLVSDSVLAFPPLILLLALTAVVTQGIGSLVLGLALVSIPTFARLSRANTLVAARRRSVAAAKGYGARPHRIILREVCPSALLAIVPYAFLVVAALIVAEGSLSYLGLGIPPPTPSWGGMIAGGQPFLSTDPWLVFTPASVMLVTVLAFNSLGERTRRHFDVRRQALSE